MAFATALALAACGGGGGGSGSDSPVASIDPSTVTFGKYLNSTFLVSVDVPNTRTREEDPSEPELVAQFAEPFSSASDQIRESVFVYRTSLDDYRPDDLSDEHLLSTRAITVDGYPAVEEVYDAKLSDSGDIDLRFMQISWRVSDAHYGLLYVGERSQFERNTQITRYMATHVKVGFSLITETETDSRIENPGKPAIASDGRNFLVISCRESDAFPYRTTLVGRLFQENRSLGTEFAVAPPGALNTNCGTAAYEAVFDGTQYWVTHVQSQGSEDYAVVARRVSVDGTVLDATPIVVSAAVDGYPIDPDIVFDGGRILVAWGESGETGSRVVGAFLSLDGLPGPRFVIADDLNIAYGRPVLPAPQVAFGGGRYLVAWSPRFFHEVRQSAMPIYAQLVASDGSLVLEQPVQVRADAGQNPRYTQVAFDGIHFLVAWIEGELHTNFIDTGSFSVRARAIDASGVLIGEDANDPGTLIAPPVLVSSGTQESPKGFLELDFHDGRYHFYWSSTLYQPEDGVYFATATPDLSSIQAPRPVVGSRADVLQPDYRFQASEPSMAVSDRDTLVAWPTRAGVVEGWFED